MPRRTRRVETSHAVDGCIVEVSGKRPSEGWVVVKFSGGEAERELLMMRASD